MRTNVRTRTYIYIRSELNNEGGVYLAMATASGSLPSLSKEAISKLDGILNCPICLDSYTDPRALPCLHTYCKKCIDQERSRRPRVVKCPECRKVCQLGGEGASTVQSFPCQQPLSSHLHFSFQFFALCHLIELLKIHTLDSRVSFNASQEIHGYILRISTCFTKKVS